MNFKNFLLAILRFYRKGISPLFVPPCCRFFPSCSSYAEEAVDQKGAWLGAWLSLKRLMKCHPFYPGGVDPLE